MFALIGLWLPWFQPEGEVIVLFGALDRQSRLLSPTAWQAFAWEDLVMAAFAVATVGLALAGRRWFLVPAGGALFTGGVLIAHPSLGVFGNSLNANETGLVPLVAFAAAAVALAAGRYRLRRR